MSSAIEATVTVPFPALTRFHSQSSMNRLSMNADSELGDMARPVSSYPALPKLSKANPLYDMVDFLKNTTPPPPPPVPVPETMGNKVLRPKASTRLMRTMKVASLIRKTSNHVSAPVQPVDLEPILLPQNVVQCVSQSGRKYFRIKAPPSDSNVSEKSAITESTAEKGPKSLPFSVEDQETFDALQTWISSLPFLDRTFSVKSKDRTSAPTSECSTVKTPESGLSAITSLSHSSHGQFQSDSRSDSIATLWPSFDGVSPSALNELFPNGTTGAIGATKKFHQSDNNLNCAADNMKKTSPVPIKLADFPRSSNRLSKPRKLAHSARSNGKGHSELTYHSPFPECTSNPPNGEKVGLKKSESGPPVKSALRCKTPTFSLVPRVEAPVSESMSLAHPCPRQKVLQHALQQGRFSVPIPPSLSTSVSSRRPCKHTPATFNPNAGVNPETQTTAVTGQPVRNPSTSESEACQIKKDLEIEPRSHSSALVRDSVFSTPPRSDASQANRYSGATAYDSRPISVEGPQRVVIPGVGRSSSNGFSFCKQPLPSAPGACSSIGSKSPSCPSRSEIGTVHPTLRWKRNSTTAIGSRPPSPQRTAGDSLESRVEALERENKLLEEALLAVLRASGRLNGCPCAFEKRGITLSALQQHRDLNLAISQQTSTDALPTSTTPPALALHPYFNPAYNSPNPPKRLNRGSTSTTSSNRYPNSPDVVIGHKTVEGYTSTPTRPPLDTHRHQKDCTTSPPR